MQSIRLPPIKLVQTIVCSATIEFRVQSFEFCVQNSRFRVEGLKLKVRIENQVMTKYWRSIEELNDPASFKKAEMRLEVDAKRAGIQNQPASRRDFLKTFGFSVVAASLVASCTNRFTKQSPFSSSPKKLHPEWPIIMHLLILKEMNIAAFW